METIHAAAAAILAFFGGAANIVLTAMDFVEVLLRYVMRDVGLDQNSQTLLLVLIVTASLVGARRMLKGVVRSAVSGVLVLVLAHVLSSIAHHDTIVNFSDFRN